MRMVSDLSKPLRWLFATLILLVAAVLGHAGLTLDRGLDLMQLHADLRGKFDPLFPGRGTTDYPGHTVDDVPKGYAKILKAELLVQPRDSREASVLARAAGQFLMTHADERRDGFPGWGVPISWDPYGDGSFNPAHTKYTISTAIVIDALLDWIEADPSAPRQRVLDLARDAMKPYLDPAVLSPSGLLPYSLEAVDRPYDTFNPAGLLAGVMQRYSLLESDAALKRAIQAVADKTVAAHLANKQVSAAGNWFWHYSITELVPNDLAHAGYIIEGMKLYAKFGGKLAKDLDLARIDRHLDDFVDRQKNRLMAWPLFRKDTNLPARSYDLGQGMFLVCVDPDIARRQGYLASIPFYRLPGGAYAKYPTDAETSLSRVAVREYEGYLLMGLAACLGERRR